jgi:hypothetical protein
VIKKFTLLLTAGVPAIPLRTYCGLSLVIPLSCVKPGWMP